jgi:DNA-binding IclR family transcriptional regulator
VLRWSCEELVLLSTVQKIGPVLDLFSVRSPEWGTSEVAAALGMSKSSAHGLLMSMAEIGLLERTPQARYRLGWRLLVLGRTAMLSAEFRRPVAAAMQDTVARWGETMHFAVFERGSAVYVEKLEGSRSIPLATRVGTRLPAHASAVGKVLLAHRGGDLAGPRRRLTRATITGGAELGHELQGVRERGVAFDDQESMRGVSCVAAPVWDRAGGLVGAVSLATSTERLAVRRSLYAEQGVELCERVSRELEEPVAGSVGER